MYLVKRKHRLLGLRKKGFKYLTVVVKFPTGHVALLNMREIESSYNSFSKTAKTYGYALEITVSQRKIADPDLVCLWHR